MRCGGCLPTTSLFTVRGVGRLGSAQLADTLPWAFLEVEFHFKDVVLLFTIAISVVPQIVFL